MNSIVWQLTQSQTPQFPHIRTKRERKYSPWGAHDVRVEVIPVIKDFVDLPFKIRYPGVDEQRLLNPFNYIRFYLDRLLPHVDKILYLDTDVIVLAEIPNMVDNHLVTANDMPIAASIRPQSFEQWVNFSEPAVEKSGIDPNTKAFNAGVLLINLSIWRTKRTSEKFEFWMHLNQDYPIYQHGSQPHLCC